MKTLLTLTLAVTLSLALASCPEPNGNGANSGYRVIYQVGEGAGAAPRFEIVAPGYILALPNQETMTHPAGKVFTGWKNGLSSATYPPYYNYIVNSDLEFIAQWTAQSANIFTVSFDVGDGSGSPPAPLNVEAGRTINLPSQQAMAAPPGKQFDGWRSGGVSYGAGASYTVNASAVFVAQWKEGGGGGTVTPPIVNPPPQGETQELAYENIGSAYRVTKGTVRSGNVVIPAYHNDLPVTEIGSLNISRSEDGAFAYTDITAISIPTTVKIIGEAAFTFCNNLTSITLPEGVTHIGSHAFWGCNNLTGVNIPGSVVSIGRFAFNDCISLNAAYIPASVTFIDDGAFGGCVNLVNLSVDAGNPNYSGGGGMLFNKSRTELLAYPAARGVINIPDGVTRIGNYAFMNCPNLTRVNIPDGVTSIGDFAFDSCGITSISNLNGMTEIGWAAFGNCTKLADITIPASVTRIGFQAFIDWNSSQTINIQGHANQASADAMWGVGWRNYCNARINYQG